MARLRETAEHKRIVRAACNKRYYAKNRDRLCADNREYYKLMIANGFRQTKKRGGGRWAEISCV